eukprot:scaffold22956_cov135-Isochrysis_galbana.AAC.2
MVSEHHRSGARGPRERLCEGVHTKALIRDRRRLIRSHAETGEGTRRRFCITPDLPPAALPSFVSVPGARPCWACPARRSGMRPALPTRLSNALPQSHPCSPVPWRRGWPAVLRFFRRQSSLRDLTREPSCRTPEQAQGNATDGSRGGVRKMTHVLAPDPRQRSTRHLCGSGARLRPWCS